MSGQLYRSMTRWGVVQISTSSHGQFGFVPGIPQVYYVGLLAGRNDMELLARTEVGRDINRHYYTSTEVTDAVRNPVVQSLFELIRLRNTHPAFAGQAQIETVSDQRFTITWKNNLNWAKLDVDFAEPRASVTYSGSSAGDQQTAGQWDSKTSVSCSEVV